MMRCREHGWTQVVKEDERRGVWIRYSTNLFEVCAGREGDDVHLQLSTDSAPTAENLHVLNEVFLYYLCDCNLDDRK